MKVSQELKDEFEKLRSGSKVMLSTVLNIVLYQRNGQYSKLDDFLFGSDTYRENNKNQIQFAKWWAGEEEIEVEEELYYLKLPFSRNAYVNLDTYDGRVFPSSKMEHDGCQTRFTMSEIENNEKLRVFKEFAKRVDEDV